ncbi:MAG: SBBP repeat-containing protein [Bacteroidota bacterium]
MKKIILVPLVYCLLFTVCCYSQIWQWAQRAGGTNADLGIGIAVDKWGNSYVTGTYLSNTAVFGSYTLPQNGFNDIFIAKYDSNGNVLWAKHAGGNNAITQGGEGGYGIVVDTLGNCYVIGSATGNASFDTITIGCSLQGNIFIAKYNSNGNCVWVKRAGGVGGDSGHGISINKNGNLYLTGSFRGTATFGTYTITTPNGLPNGLPDVFIAKYDLNGNCIWVRQGNSIAGGSSISADAMGNCYVTGGFSDSVKFGSYKLTSLGGGDVFVAKYDSSGNCLWAKSGGSVANDGGTGISADGFGNCYVTGEFDGTVTATYDTYSLTGDGSANIFILKYDSIGSCKWAKQANGAGIESGYGIATNKTSNIYVSGQCYSPPIYFGSYFLSSSGAFIAKFDSSGNCIEVAEGNASYAAGRAICIDTSDNAYVTGTFKNTAAFGSINIVDVGNGDFFVAKLNGITGVPSNNERRSNFIIYPNPSNGSYTMQISQDLLKSKMFIYDTIGQMIFQTTLSQNSTSINIPNLIQGVYIVKLQTLNGS